jgi:hypothetical protein
MSTKKTNTRERASERAHSNNNTLAVQESEEEERKTPRSQKKKKDPSKGNGDSPIAVQLEQCMLSCY